MNKLTFDTAAFIKTMVFFVVLTTSWTFGWTYFSKPYSEHSFLSSLGFLLILPLSIYWGMGRKKLSALITTLIATNLVFVIGTFAVGMVMEFFSPSSQIPYALVNSFFVAFSMTIIFDRCYGVRFGYLTTALVYVFLLLAYYLLNKYKDGAVLLFDIKPAYAMFIVFQGLMLIPLAVGLNMDRVEAES
ncbi:MAG: hypothetical protein J7623_28310 [Chitinophaga sp.]|uniref:hypothetical protein n=1 Tax=Chitinophaga sp. TaxID=1869181 RepID=UPI001B04185C|nr:hypothetical protein [Chitinophaga sp.]MBO9732580.1 hypothetical protein [Chitinophaga sp.]